MVDITRTKDRAMVRIRPATGADYEVAGAICVAAYGAGDQLVGDYGEELADVAGRAGISEVLVADDPDTGAVVGTVTFVPPGSPLAELAGDDEAEFRMLAVDPSAQGRGIGSALTRACLDRAAALGYAAVAIYTLSTNATAIGMYERLGFVRVPERDWTFEEGLTLVALRAPVPAR
jgi:ribosomal protein S18 acetylase RimI-like enzyme